MPYSEIPANLVRIGAKKSSRMTTALSDWSNSTMNQQQFLQFYKSLRDNPIFDSDAQKPILEYYTDYPQENKNRHYRALIANIETVFKNHFDHFKNTFFSIYLEGKANIAGDHFIFRISRTGNENFLLKTLNLPSNNRTLEQEYNLVFGETLLSMIQELKPQLLLQQPLQGGKSRKYKTKSRKYKSKSKKLFYF